MQDFAGLGINSKHLPRTDTSLGHHVFGLIVVSTDLGRQGNEVVFGDYPTSRAKSVPIQHTDGVATVGENQAGWTIPRFHMHGVVLIECPQLGIHGIHILPGRRDHHSHGTEQVDTTGQQYFQHIVHAGGI